jgi:hypothetical protein
MSLDKVKKNIKELKKESVTASLGNKWSSDEEETLKYLLNEGITSATFIYKKKLIPDRTYDSISNKIFKLKRSKVV